MLFRSSWTGAGAEPSVTPIAPPAPVQDGCNAKPGEPGDLEWGNIGKVGRLSLDWADASCATKYTIVVRDTTKNGVIVVRKRNLVQSRYETGVLPGGKTFLWRVTACNNFGCSKSKWHEFTLAPETSYEPSQGAAAQSSFVAWWRDDWMIPDSLVQMAGRLVAAAPSR